MVLKGHPTTPTDTQYTLLGLRHIKTSFFGFYSKEKYFIIQLSRKNCKIMLIHISSKLLSSKFRYIQRSPERSMKQKSQRWAWLTHPYSFFWCKHCIFQRGEKPYKIFVTQSGNSERGRGKVAPQERKEIHFCTTNILLSVQGGRAKPSWIMVTETETLQRAEM